MTQPRFHILLLAGAPLLVQGQTVTAYLDTGVIRIGERARLIIDVNIGADPTARKVQWPVVGDTLNAHVEVVRTHGPDTLSRDGESLMRTIHDLTSFDTGFWALPPMTLTVDGQVVETTPLVLEVRSVDPDGTGTLRPAKPIIGPRMAGWLLHLERYALHLAAGALLMAALLFLLFRRRRPATADEPVAKGPALTLRQRTIAALEALRQRKLWQQGQVKEHHSEATDILRAFIEERYGVPAMERTTDELLRQLRLSSLPAEHCERLRNILQLADLVKFAKLTPGALENEEVLEGALQLVRDTPEPDTESTAHAS